MKRITMLSIVWCSVLLFAASTCFAQMYTVTDLGASRSPTAINSAGQVVGNYNGHAFLWTNQDGFQDLGTLPGGTFSRAAAINDLGVVTGTADGLGTVSVGPPSLPDFPPYDCASNLGQPFVWTPHSGMQGLGIVLYGGEITAYGYCGLLYYATDINIGDQVVGSNRDFATYKWGFLWTSLAGITTLATAYQTSANGINSFGHLVGQTGLGSLDQSSHAALWTNGNMSDLGTLVSVDPTDWSSCSAANGINELDQVVGWSSTVGAQVCFIMQPPGEAHAFLWSQGEGMHDLGTLPGDASSIAHKIDSFGQVIGSSGNFLSYDADFLYILGVSGRPFIWSEHSEMMDLNTLISPDSGWTLTSTGGINSWGQIVGEGTLNGQPQGFLLTPIYKASVQQPINGDGTSIFSAKRGVVPVKFALTQYDLPTCNLLPATIAVTRTAGGTLGSIDESTYLTNADSGSNFRINGCQYIYNLGASSLGVGTYRVDISINGIMVGHAVFALK